MGKRGAAAVSAMMSVLIALGVGIGVASANEHPPPAPKGDTCKIEGNFNVVVAPNCGAQYGPGTTTTTTTTTLPPLVVNPIPFDPGLCGLPPEYRPDRCPR